MKQIAIGFVSVGLAAVAVLSAAAQAPPGAEAGTRRFQPPPLLRVLDADGDGEISMAELDGAAPALKKLDHDQDGKLTRDELFGGPGPRGGRGPGEGMGPRGGFGPPRPPESASGSPDNPLLPKDDAEKKILDALDAVRQGPRFANVPATDGRLLRLLTEAVGAKHVVEIGTSTGESGVWFALALRKTGGKLTTYEIDPGRAKTAQENFERAGVREYVTIVLGDAHEKVKELEEPIDVLFLDADKQGYIDYLDKLLPRIRPGGLILAHNMRSPTPDPRFVKAITRDPNLETAFLLMDGAGVSVTLKKR
ncbi:MAG: class I SAM-dependent methyltransferase [Pirellulales bacterium]|nr:class I SAM-dependent methyltransferase [Pirellulales bacterium]